MEPFHFVACDDRHAPAILAILNEAIVNSTALYDYVPRQPAQMAAWFEAKRKGNFPVIGAVNDADVLLGFASYGTFRAYPAYKYTVEHSVYVEKSWRGQGLGRKLLEKAIKEAQRQDYHTMIGVIDSANAVSIALHRALGFERCSQIKHAGFKFGRWLDVEFYQLLLPTPERPVEG
jgi:phosphinothricin acetyltransferase